MRGQWWKSSPFNGFRSEAASFDPGLRSRLFAILDVALLRLRFQKNCALALEPKSTISDWIPDQILKIKNA